MRCRRVEKAFLTSWSVKRYSAGSYSRLLLFLSQRNTCCRSMSGAAA